MTARYLLIICLFTLLATSCSKSGSEKDREAPVISLVSPLDGQSFNAGETVAITGQLSDNKILSEVHIHISNIANGDLLVDIHRYPGAGTYELNETFVGLAGIQYRIQVIVKDNSANESRATVNVIAN